jgi:3-dehydroquinate synthetase
VVEALQHKHQVHSVVLQDGEQYKCMDELMNVWDKALEARLGRGMLLVTQLENNQMPGRFGRCPGDVKHNV